MFAIKGIIIQGHQVASGLSNNSPFPKGTIQMQASIFMALEPELDLSNFYMGTLNVSIAPSAWEMVTPWKSFKQIKWYEHHNPEDFYFMHCNVCYKNQKLCGYVYYPSPSTKKMHHQSKSTLEILAPEIVGIAYNEFIVLELDPKEISIIESP